MQIKSILLVATAAVTAFGFAIPEGQPDGFYSHTVVNGTDIHMKIAERYSGPITKRAPRILGMEEQPAKVYCGRALNLNHEDKDAVNADLDRQCGNGVLIGGGYNFYAIRGGTVAFVCNFRYFYDHHRCYEDTRVQSSKVITEFCGPYNSGWINYEYGWMSYGYAPRHLTSVEQVFDCRSVIPLECTGICLIRIRSRKPSRLAEGITSL